MGHQWRRLTESETDSIISVIETAVGFVVHLNGSGRAEIGISLPTFAEEEIDIEITEC